MSSRLSIEELNEAISNSAFNRSSYKVDIRLANFFAGLSMYTHGHDDLCTLGKNPSRFVEAIPDFQRDNDKWTREMQVGFIENIIKGYTTTIMLYEVIPSNVSCSTMCECKILDGLQRMTALYKFANGEFTVFGYTHDELFTNKVYRMALQTIKVQVYSFDSEIEAVEFYISMNENITHSKEDIKRAKNYLAGLIKDTTK